MQFAGEVTRLRPDARTSARRRCGARTAVTQLGFAAAADALADAGELGADPSRCAVIAATGVGGLETMEDNETTFLARGASRVSPFFVPMMMPNATAGMISINFGWTGPEPVHRHRVRGGQPTPSARACASCATAAPTSSSPAAPRPGHAAHHLRVRPHGLR